MSSAGLQGGSGGGGGNVATDSIFDAKGDLAVGTGADTAIRLAVGANGYVLTADSTETSGLKWAVAAASGSSGSGSVLDMGERTNTDGFYNGGLRV